jgi:shikimate dehydrogenase
VTRTADRQLPAVRRAGVLGHPVAHSLSPALHRAAYEALGLDGWSYDAYDVTADQLGDFLAGLDDTWAGLSLTMPLKAAVLPLLDDATPLVHAVGAANTVVISGQRRSGDNTDVPGMVAALDAHGVREAARVAVLGGGATARSALAAAATLTGRATVHSRSPERAEPLRATATAVGVALEIGPWEDAADALGAPLVVNTTPPGAADALADALPAEVGTLFEVAYDPWPTVLSAAWSQRGGRVVDGLDLLVQQAVLQVGLMTGAHVDVPGFAAHLREAGERALRTR